MRVTGCQRDSTKVLASLPEVQITPLNRITHPVKFQCSVNDHRSCLNFMLLNEKLAASSSVASQPGEIRCKGVEKALKTSSDPMSPIQSKACFYLYLHDRKSHTGLDSLVHIPNLTAEETKIR